MNQSAGWEDYKDFAGNPLLWLVLLLTVCLIYTLNGRQSAPGARLSPVALTATAPGLAPLPAPGISRTPAAISQAPDLPPDHVTASPLRPAAGALPTPSLGAKALILFLFAAIYALAYQPWANYTLLFTLGALAATYAGAQLGFYTPGMAWQALAGNLDILCFLAGMNLLTEALSLAGVFEYLGGRVAALASGDHWRLMLGFCLSTYAVSLLVNNLTTMMVLVPIVLNLCKRLKLEPRPYLVGMIVASNLGGASTMIGDFPNILIAARAGVGFNQFLVHMMPICLALLAVTLAYLRVTQAALWELQPEKADTPARPAYDPLFAPERRGARAGYESPFADIGKRASGVFADSTAAVRGLAILGAALIAFIFCDLAGIPPALIAAGAGLAALFLTGLDKGRLLKGLAYRDLLFFAALFVLVGAARASGLLDWFGELIFHLSFGSMLLRCLLLMWVAAAATALLNAGPCTALFIPLIFAFKTAAPDNLYWWSLSLGVLAGSSATLTGATAGSVTATLLSTHQARAGRTGGLLTFRGYAREAAPLALIFLAVSSLYITWLYWLG
ncbi:MAG: SLC13 family permease [Elusimicrobiota bacterium]|nr:SLC13 family permease [Elusimicrobiota bacterium]